MERDAHVSKRCLAATIVLVAAAALAFGWPTRHGDFLNGDDQRFVTEQVFVNHPSWRHAWRLLTTIHGVLYQPIPMLTFQANYALAAREPGSRFAVSPYGFRLTNIILHAANAVLVCLVVRRLSIEMPAPQWGLRPWPNDTPKEQRESLRPWPQGANHQSNAPICALIAGLMFACHPLALEPVAWISGRMILLATFFSLVLLLACLTRRPNGGGAWPWAGGAAWLLALLSKVLPTVPLAAAWADYHSRGRPQDEEPRPARRGTGILPVAVEDTGKMPVPRGSAGRLPRRAWLTYGILLLMTAGAAGFATALTARFGLIEQTQAEATTNAAVRVLLAGRHYLESYVWPSRLAAWSPPPDKAAFFSTDVGIAILEWIAVGATMWLARRRAPLAFLGLGLFVILLAPFLTATLARRLLAADRYMYLPIFGLHLALAAVVMQAWGGLSARLGRRPREDASRYEEPRPSGRAAGRCGTGVSPVEEYAGETPVPDGLAGASPSRPREDAVRYEEPRPSGRAAGRCGTGVSPVEEYAGETPVPDGLAGASPSRARRAAAVIVGLPVAALLGAWLVAGWRYAPCWADSVARDRRTVAVYPDRVDARVELAKAHVFQKEPDAALAVIAEARRRWPDDARLAAQAGEALRLRRDWPRAAVELTYAAERMPRRSRTHYHLALTLEELGRPNDARAIYQRLVEEATPFLPAAVALARNYRAAGEIQAAIETLERAVGEFPYHRDARFDLAALYIQVGDWRRAQAQLEALLDVYAEDAPARLNLGAVLVQLGQTDRALAEYARLLQVDPSAAAGRVNRAALLASLGRTSEAEADYRTVLDRQPDNLSAAIGLHELLQEQRRSGDLVALWTAFPHDRMDPDGTWAWLAWAYVLAGDDDAARAAVAALPEAAQSRAFADWALAYAALRDRNEAALRQQLGPTPHHAEVSATQREQARIVLAALAALPVETRDSPAGLYALVRTLMFAGDVTTARDALDRLRALPDAGAWGEPIAELSKLLADPASAADRSD